MRILPPAARLRKAERAIVHTADAQSSKRSRLDGNKDETARGQRGPAVGLPGDRGTPEVALWIAGEMAQRLRRRQPQKRPGEYRPKRGAALGTVGMECDGGETRAAQAVVPILVGQRADVTANAPGVLRQDAWRGIELVVAAPKEGPARYQVTDVRHGEDENAARPEHTRDFAKRGIGHASVLHDLDRHHSVEGGVGIRQPAVQIGQLEVHAVDRESATFDVAGLDAGARGDPQPLARRRQHTREVAAAGAEAEDVGPEL